MGEGMFGFNWNLFKDVNEWFKPVPRKKWNTNRTKANGTPKTARKSYRKAKRKAQRQARKRS